VIDTPFRGTSSEKNEISVDIGFPIKCIATYFLGKISYTRMNPTNQIVILEKFPKD
jgi:hypothetical protein